MEEILLFNKIFPIVDTCLSCEEPDKPVRWCADGDDFLRHFCFLFSASHVQHISHLQYAF